VNASSPAWRDQPIDHVIVIDSGTRSWFAEIPQISMGDKLPTPMNDSTSGSRFKQLKPEHDDT
jgi:hypothetical protein